MYKFKDNDLKHINDRLCWIIILLLLILGYLVY